MVTEHELPTLKAFLSESDEPKPSCWTTVKSCPNRDRVRTLKPDPTFSIVETDNLSDKLTKD
jgi:hypothetical protein